MIGVQFGISALLAFCFLVVSPIYTHAETQCGSIIEYEDDGEGNVTEQVTSIDNCANPFNLAVPNTGLEVSFDATRIDEGGSYPFVGVIAELTLQGTHPEANSISVNVYKTIGRGYELVPQNDDGTYAFHTAGTYTVVVNEDMLIVTQSVLQKLFAFIIPTAYAFPGVSAVITFTVTELAPEPEGISNILFLPGLQASRLYTEIDGEEEKVWEPGGDSDIERLRMTEDGESIANVYTKDVVDELLNGANIYRDFLTYLRDIEGPFAGPIIETFPYDWRRDVFDIVEQGTKVSNTSIEKPIETLAFLAATSPTDKVTIIAHSNGGLLAKAIMLKLEEEGRTDLVDKVIFIASPHIGTPKGLAALLHGYDQEILGGLLASDERVRDVMKNMPGVYGLLPSETYIESLGESLISFDGSPTTKIFRDAYGFTLSNMDEYTRFLVGDEGREDSGDTINKPSTANAGMLARAFTEHREKLDDWIAPEGVQVFNIVGTGLPTPKSIEYREYNEMYCYGGVVITCTEPVIKPEPVLHFTRYGDRTVISKSANSIGDNKYIDVFSTRVNHANITESEITQNLIDHIIHGSPV